MPTISRRGLVAATLPPLLAAVVLWALCAKLLVAVPHPRTGEMLVGVRAFAWMIEGHGLVPAAGTLAFAWLVLVGEGVLVVLLLCASTARLGLRLLASFVVAASAYVVAARLYHGPVTCGCFGGLTPATLGTMLARNGGILLASIAGMWLAGERREAAYGGRVRSA